MKFVDVAGIFETIEQESSRNEMTKHLADLYNMCDEKEAQIVSYLSLGSLFPPYRRVQLQIAKKSMVKILADLLGESDQIITDQIKQKGDLGLVVQELFTNKDQGLTVQEVYDYLAQAAQISGTGSTEKKLDAIVTLLKQVDQLAAKYIVRIVTGTLRLGFSDMTILDALSWMEVGDKSIRKNLEHAYNICADLGLVAYTLKKSGIQGIEKLTINVGIPIRPAAAERAASSKAVIEKLGTSVAQPKLDGFRIQLHIKKVKEKTEVYFFSRNLLDMSEMFPDLEALVKDLPVKSLICEGEAIVYDQHSETFLPFQETVKRKRKHDIDAVSQELPLYLYLFDLLYLDGHSMLEKTHTQRRKALEGIVDNTVDELQVIEEKKVTNEKELHDYFLQNIHAGLEGLVVKREDAIYQPGKRNFNWIKLKRHARGKLTDTLDCVILGYYSGSGKRASFGIGAFLVGVYDAKTDQFQTVAKIGTGMKDHEWKELKIKCDQIERSTKSKRVNVPKELYPDVWVEPQIVCTIQCEEITLSPTHTAGKADQDSGYALRFPRFISYRDDKSAEDTTTVKELISLYNLQKK